MLVMLFIKMTWYKNDRNPQGAVIRKQYYAPRVLEELSKNVKKEEEKNLSDIVICNINCVQNGSEVKEAFSIQHCDCNVIEQHGIPNIDIVPEEKGYRIKWFDSSKGTVRRRGGNEDFGKKGRKLAGVPNVLNETAFVLGENTSGKMSWNNRFTSYHGQWYEQYQLYLVNTTGVEEKSYNQLFMREYDYEYCQMADLF